MLISQDKTAILKSLIGSGKKDVYCSGLFLSARWFVASQIGGDGLNMIVLPDKDSAEYCAADLYSLVQGDIVFFLPDSGRNIERSNYKSSLGVQRTSAVSRIISAKNHSELLYVVTYPEALEELIPQQSRISEALLTIRKGEDVNRETILSSLTSENFLKVDFVSAPGQFALRGSIVDIFSYSSANPYRISFFGDEVEKINIFDCNTQLSIDECDTAEIFPDILAGNNAEDESISIADILPENSVVWLDSSDVYKDKQFLNLLKNSSVYSSTLPCPARTRLMSSSTFLRNRYSIRILNCLLPI